MSKLVYKISPGDHFGRLTVVKQIGHCYKNHDRLYECKCECGNTKNVSASALYRGYARSCGCLLKDRLKNRPNKQTVCIPCERCGRDDDYYSVGLCHSCYNILRLNKKLDDWKKYHEIKSEEDLYFNRKDSGIDKWMMQLNDRIRQEKEEAYV